MHARILVARVVGFEDAENGVRFQVLHTLKGTADPEIVIDGREAPPLTSPTRLAGSRFPENSKYRDTDFSAAVPDNGCGMSGFRRGRAYVLFLEPDESMHPMISLLGARLREAVRWPDDPWIDAVRAYTTIEAAADPTAAMNDLRAELETDSSRSVLAADLTQHAVTPSLMKPLAVNRTLLASEDSRTASLALWAVLGQDPELGDAITTDLLASDRWMHFADPVTRHAAEQGWTEYVDLFTDAALSQSDWTIKNPAMSALLSLADRRHTRQMLAVAADSPGYSKSLIRWFVDHPSRKARDFYRALVAEQPEEGWWIAPPLAAMGDRLVATKAIRMIRTGEHDPWFETRYRDGNWIPYYVIARSPLPEASREARRVIRDGSPQVLEWLIQGYGESKSRWRWKRIEEIIDRSNGHADVTLWLRQVLSANQDVPEGRALLERLNRRGLHLTR
ncbi:MAG: hypothetical protein AAGA23_02405 [Pseudomonadota bacterium]